MARFSQQFLAGFTQPGLTRGLLDLGTALGSVPGEVQKRKRERETMGMLRSMGDVERADYMASVAKTADELLEAEAAKDAAIKKGSLTSLQGLEVARQAAETDAEKLRIEGIMSRVAVQAGVDPTTIAGRTQREADQATQRELQQGRLEEQQRAERERALTNAYYRMSGDDLKAFEQNLIDSNFGYIIDDIKEDKAKDDLFTLQLKNAKTKAAENAAMKKAPLPKTTLRERIEDANIDPKLKEQFLSELNDIKEPDFEADETWNPGERKLAESALASLNTAVRNEVSKEVSRKSAIKADIRTLEKQLAKPPTKAQVDSYLAEAEKQLDTSWYSDPSEEEIKTLAFNLARLAKNNDIEELIEQRRAQLGEVPQQFVEEPEEEEESTEITLKADEIVGL
jgi:hypothetical protein